MDTAESAEFGNSSSPSWFDKEEGQEEEEEERKGLKSLHGGLGSRKECYQVVWAEKDGILLIVIGE